MLTFRDSNESFKLDDLLETKTFFDFNVNHANPPDQKLIYEFGKEMNFDIKQKGRKRKRDKSVIKLLKSPSIMASASGISITKFSPSDPDELCNRLKLIIQEQQAGNISDKVND